MGSVCRKHQEFYETECRWCEPANVVAPLAVPPMTCEMLRINSAETCGGPAAWRWVAVSGYALMAKKKEYFFCDVHGAKPVGGWSAERTS